MKGNYYINYIFDLLLGDAGKDGNKDKKKKVKSKKDAK